MDLPVNVGIIKAPDGQITLYDTGWKQLDNARPIGIAVDGDNNVWYADLTGWIGRLDARRARGR